MKACHITQLTRKPAWDRHNTLPLYRVRGRGNNATRTLEDAIKMASGLGCLYVKVTLINKGTALWNVDDTALKQLAREHDAGLNPARLMSRLNDIESSCGSLFFLNTLYGWIRGSVDMGLPETVEETLTRFVEAQEKRTANSTGEVSALQAA